jgi:predicted metal-dependent hydrolase
MFQLNLGFWKSKLASPKKPLADLSRIRRDQSFPWKHGITVHLIRQPRARRYLLRLRAGNEARLVIPRGGSQAEALRFLERSEAWLLEQRTKSQNQDCRPWTDGASFLFRGENVILRLEDKEGAWSLHFSDQKIALSSPLPDYCLLIQNHLRRLAKCDLSTRTWELAGIHGIIVQRVTIRAQKTRWGSCSARGTISLNWRLIQAPPQVRDYLIIHELMHRREMNHSARFWKLVAEACPDYRVAEQWLKKIRLRQD